MKHPINYYFLGSSGLLLACGMVFLATLSGIESLQAFGNTHYYTFHQLAAAGIGIFLGLVAFFMPLRIIKKLALPALIINLGLLIAVFLPMFGTKIWGAQRWINIAGVSLQPSEFLKITAVMYLAAWLANKTSENYKKGWILSAKKGYHDAVRVFLPFLALLAVIAVILYFQKDASTLGITSIALISVYFAAGTPLWTTFALMAMGVCGALALIRFEPYRINRFLVFLHPEADPLGIGFQLKQSILAVGSGGLFGKGLGMSTQKFGFLPQAMGDSIFAIIGEELGIIGCAALIGLFIFFFWQGIRIALNSTDKFGKLAAIGICTWIILQTFMNIASSIGVFPLTGIPLPFFSYGGSHLMAELAAVGLLLNISRNKIS